MRMQVIHAVVVVHSHTSIVPAIVTEARVVSAHADLEIESRMDMVPIGPGGIIEITEIVVTVIRAYEPV